MNHENVCGSLIRVQIPCNVIQQMSWKVFFFFLRKKDPLLGIQEIRALLGQSIEEGKITPGAARRANFQRRWIGYFMFTLEVGKSLAVGKLFVMILIPQKFGP